MNVIEKHPSAHCCPSLDSDFPLSSVEYGEMRNRVIKRMASNQRLDLEEAETMATEGGRELSRKFLQDVLNGLGHGDVGKSLSLKDGQILRRKRLRTRKIRTLTGELNLTRIGYFEPSVKSKFPLDAYLNLSPSIYSHNLRRRVAMEVARGPFGNVASILRESHGVSLHKAQIQEIAVSAAVDFEKFYEQQLTLDQQELAAKAPILVLSLDSKGIVMRKGDLTEQTQKAADSAHKLKHRLTKGEKLNRKRMATAAAVYGIEQFIRKPEEVISELNRVKERLKKRRPKPLLKRVWARLDAAEAVTDAVIKEALRRDPEIQKQWVVLVDGENHQIKRIQKALKQVNAKATLILDIIHVIEYLWRSAHVFFPQDHRNAEEWVSDKILKILSGKAGYVAAGIRRSATNRKIAKGARSEVDVCANYILNRSSMMQYRDYLKKGFPIATGVIEGVCRHVIKDRMDLTGARWSLEVADAILKLRSLLASGDFEAYWPFHVQNEFSRNYSELEVSFDPSDRISL